MNNFLTKNLPWKITSLILATILWLFVINIQNPMQPQEIRNIPVTIKGITQLAEKGFVLKNQEEIRNQKISVRVKGPRLQTDKLLANNRLISITLDLTKYMSDLSADSVQNIASYDVLIDVQGVNVINLHPEIRDIVLEREKTITKEVYYKFVGNTNSQYTALTPTIKPSTVEIGGAKSDIEYIDKAIVEIDVSNFSEDQLIRNVPIKVLDGDGKEIKGLTKNPQFVEVKLPIGKKKVVPLEAAFKGTLPKGYVHTNTIVTPNQITIVGKAATVDAVKKIRLKEIPLDDIIQTSVVKTEMILPEGVQYIDNIDNEINVTVEIKKENSYSYSLPVSQLHMDVTGMKEGLGYEVLTDTIELVLSATAEELLALKPQDIKAKIDLTNLGEGEYTIPIEMIVPSQFIIVNKPININVRLISINNEPPAEAAEEEARESAVPGGPQQADTAAQ